MTDIFSIGLKDGLIWYPFILGLGLLYSYLRHIDVSIDGIAIISGIVAAVAWEASSSYTISILSSIITGMSCSIMISLLISSLGIQPLMAGVVFSLAAHSISVLWIGESLSLSGTKLMPGMSYIPLWLPVLLLFIGMLTHLFYSTKFGISIRRLGDGISINHTRSPFVLQLAAYALSGALYGLAAGLYSHSEGAARSGGSFEVLIVSLSAFLCVDRIVELFSRLTLRMRDKEEGGVLFASSNKHFFINVWQIPSVKAFIGAIFFQTLVFFIISKTPNPIYWKIFFSIVLILSLIRYDWLYKLRLKPLEIDNNRQDDLSNFDLSIKNLNMSYEIGIERRRVFKNAAVSFNKGLNLLCGPNGSGKSTLLGIISGAINPDSAAISYGGINFGHVNPHKRPVFLIHQDPFRTLSPSLTVAENLVASLPRNNFALKRYSQDSVISRLEKDLISYNLQLIAQSGSPFWNKPACTLSGGQASYIAFYCGMISECSILLADEPSTGLDDANFQSLVRLLSAISKYKIVIVTTHDERLISVANTEYEIVDFSLRQVI